MLIVVHQLLGQPLTVSFALANELVSFQSLHTQRQSCRRRRFRVAQNSRCRFCWADRCSSGRDPLFSHLERGKGRSSSVSSTPVRRTVALPTSLHSTAVSASFFFNIFSKFSEKKIRRAPSDLFDFFTFFSASETVSVSGEIQNCGLCACLACSSNSEITDYNSHSYRSVSFAYLKKKKISLKVSEMWHDVALFWPISRNIGLRRVGGWVGGWWLRVVHSIFIA